MKICRIFLAYFWNMIILNKKNILIAGNRGGGYSPVEESPDCIERGALLKRRVLWTIFHGKTSATESRPPPQGGKGERVG